MVEAALDEGAVRLRPQHGKLLHEPVAPGEAAPLVLAAVEDVQPLHEGGLHQALERVLGAPVVAVALLSRARLVDQPQRIAEEGVVGRDAVEI